MWLLLTGFHWQFQLNSTLRCNREDAVFQVDVGVKLDSNYHDLLFTGIYIYIYIYIFFFFFKYTTLRENSYSPSWFSSFNSSATASPGIISLLSAPQTRTPSDLLLLTFSRKAALSFLVVLATGSCVFNSFSGRLDVPRRLAEDPEANLGTMVKLLTGMRLGVNPLKKSSSRTC